MRLKGHEWYALREIIRKALEIDEELRKQGKALLYRRSLTERALEELERAAERSRRWIVVVERTWPDHPSRVIHIITEKPERHVELLAQNERVLYMAPLNACLIVTSEVLFGIANACCKLLGLSEGCIEIGEEPPLSDEGRRFAERMWSRCHLFWRRSQGAIKAAWRRKGWIVEFETEAPDFREDRFHKKAKLIYDLEEIEE